MSNIHVQGSHREHTIAKKKKNEEIYVTLIFELDNCSVSEKGWRGWVEKIRDNTSDRRYSSKAFSH